MSRLNPSTMSDYELLIRMIRASSKEERSNAMEELTHRIHQGKVDRNIRLIKGRLQGINFKESTEDERESVASKAIRDFKLTIDLG